MNRKLDLLTTILNRLTSITTANGYQIDIGSNATYWHDLDFEYGEQDAVTFRDGLVEIKEPNQYHEYCLQLEIEAISFTDDVLNKSCQLEADLVKAVGVDPTWGGLAVKTVLKGMEKAVETKGKRAVRVVVRLEVTYRDLLWLKVPV